MLGGLVGKGTFEERGLVDLVLPLGLMLDKPIMKKYNRVPDEILYTPRDIMCSSKQVLLSLSSVCPFYTLFTG